MSEKARTTIAETDAGELKPRRRTAPWLLGGLVLLPLSVLIALQAFGLWTVVPPDTASDTLLLYALSSLNFAAFIVFTFIFIRNLLKLRRERRERKLGSKIKTRLIVYFISVSLLPITAMAVFSYLFLNRSLEKWFYRLPEDIVKEAGKVQREAEEIQHRSLQENAALLAVMLEASPDFNQESMLTRFIQSGHLSAVEIAGAGGEVLVESHAQLPDIERRELEHALMTARLTRGADHTLADGKGFDVATIPLSNDRLLSVASPRRAVSALSEILTDSKSEYSKLVARQRKVRLLGLSTLGLLTLLLLFAATWVAIHLARGLAKPIQALAEASNEVARGNLSHRVSAIADDELALLADSFNQMTAQLDENRRHIEAGATALREKNLALEERRNYIETILESLSTGVISLDESGQVTTINAAAAAMLRLETAPPARSTLSDITGPEDSAIIERLIRRARRMSRASEQTELARGSASDGGALPVALTATALRAPGGEERGVVIVIEDLSELLAAQRAAAWSEVARRMAHEIKNPLTPIQLSAERIARNFHRGANGDSQGGANGNGGAERARVAQVVDECTATITREVAGLKAMVDEFSRFARLPHARLETADLNDVIRQSVSLYEERLNGVRLDVALAPQLPPAMLDAEQIRRVFVNLIDNALEALENVEGEKRITVATAHDHTRALLLAEVTDTGQGIPRSDFRRLFQPYFSTRGRGTGLGLAIVQRIITDHGGRIRAEANRPRGAKFTIEIPTTT
jgi:two-component system, NtrC family, nitrogen regulation sensor histidine kinase NtrY